MRIVSLIASATEMIASLGYAGEIVGISHECDYPPEAVEGRPVVTKPKIDTRKKSLNIHKDVQAIVEQGLGVYTIDAEVLKTLQPDLIITQDQCEVCAVTYEDVVKATQSCLETDARIVTLHPDSLDDIFSDFLKVGKALDEKERAEQLVEELKEKMDFVAEEANKQKKKPRVVCLEWMKPLMAAGNWIPQMVEMAGGINGLTRNGEHTRIVPWDELKEYDPDILLMMPCGYTIAQTEENRADLENLPGWKDLSACKNRRVFIIDGNTYMNRPGPRILESLYILAGLLHPNVFGGYIPEGSVRNWTK